jgi:hypothetical protein
MLEAYVELTNLHENADYVGYMEASFNKERIRLLEEAKKNSNPYLKRISLSQHLDEQITISKKELANLKAKGVTPLSAWERFKRAGMVSEYRSIYSSLSNDAHGNISALINRHVEIHKDGFSVVYYKQRDYLTYLDSAAGLLTNASIKIHTFFHTDNLVDIEQLKSELEKLRISSSSPSNRKSGAD